MFNAASQNFSNSASSADWGSALKSGLDGIMKYGHAKPGDRSMVIHSFLYFF